MKKGLNLLSLALFLSLTWQSPELHAQECGVIHNQAKPQAGRTFAIAYVPEGPYYDALACLVEKANSNWQTSCPESEIPFIAVSRGDRPADNSRDISVRNDLSPYPGSWEPKENSINFDGSTMLHNWECDDPYSEAVATHELGHALGLDRDFCSELTQFRSIMNEPIDFRNVTNPPYMIRPGHCQNIEAANFCGDDANCCFYCLPPLRDKCQVSPELCGTEPSPAGGGFCTYSVTINYGSVVTYEGSFGTIVNSYVNLVSSYLSCTSLTQSPPAANGGLSRSVQTDGLTPGPTLYLRSRYPDGASGLIDIRGVARDDTWGIQRLEFWLDGEPITLQSLQMRQHDPYTCSEWSPSSCDPHSGFQGQLDTSQLSLGPHILQVLALSDHPERIPVYLEWPFEVVPDCEPNPPSVNIVQPLTAQTVSGTVLVVAEAADETGLERVKFLVDGTVIRNDTTYPYNLSWDTLSVADGWRDLTAEAHDVCDNVTTSLLTRVRVQNGSSMVQTAPIADAWVSQTWPTTNYGTTNYLRIRTIDGGVARHTYLKFQVTGITGNVTSAKLRLRTQDRTLSEPVTIYRIADTLWQESIINFTNASSAVLWSTPVQVPLAADTWHEMDVTGAIVGDGVYTFALATSANQGNLDFWSRESVYPPVLEIAFQP